jgi:hypothetical protein
MLQKISAIAAECFRRPGYTSVWSTSAGKYVCSKEPEYREAVRQQSRASLPPINPAFKLVFVTAAGGTLLFALICLGIHALFGEQMPKATEKLADGFFSMVQIGFGAIVGLLGGKVLHGNVEAPEGKR